MLAHLPRLRLSDPERSTLAEVGKRLRRKALTQVACVAKPDTILNWYRRLVAEKFNGSKLRSYPGRPRVDSGRSLHATRIRHRTDAKRFVQRVSSINRTPSQLHDRRSIQRYNRATCSMWYHCLFAAPFHARPRSRGAFHVVLQLNTGQQCKPRHHRAGPFLLPQASLSR